jgi:hypothetical protein
MPKLPCLCSRFRSLLLAMATAACLPAWADLPSIEKRLALANEMGKLAERSQPAALVQALKTLAASKQREDSGVWALSVAYRGVVAQVDVALKEPAKSPTLAANLRRGTSGAWFRQLTPVLRAIVLERQAWHARGLGFASTTTPEGRRQFARLIQQAIGELDAVAERERVDPHWYAQRISLATFASEGQAQVRRLLQQGIALEPLYYETYFAALFAATPRWGGSVDEMVALINELGSRPLQNEGTSLYARLVWSAEESREWNVLQHPKLEWSKMKTSFQDVLKSYPDEWNAQKFLFMACEHGDMATVRQLAPYIKHEASKILLEKNVPIFDKCLALARGTGEPFLLRDPNTGKQHMMQ